MGHTQTHTRTHAHLHRRHTSDVTGGGGRGEGKKGNIFEKLEREGWGWRLCRWGGGGCVSVVVCVWGCRRRIDAMRVCVEVGGWGGGWGGREGGGGGAAGWEVVCVCVCVC